jgi:hypothetical protein
MKKFILHLSIISILTLSVILLILSRADGWTDPFYIRFTTPKQQNMILGTSRAAQGLQTKKFEQILNQGFYNYAFTVAHSPFGKVYYESIKRKHSRKKGGLFIVAVDPWSISSWCESPNDLEQFRENNLFLDKIKIVDFNPNIFYLLDNLSGNYLDILFKKKSSMFLHKDGWLEVSNIKMDSVSVANRVSNKIETYRYTYLPKTNYSSIRLDYLVKTIIYLKEYGNVYLVRLPIHEGMMEVEEELMPDFDLKIKEAIDLSSGYLDMTPQNELFEYTDGNHLYKESGKKVSTYVGNWISKKEKARTHNRVDRPAN